MNRYPAGSWVVGLCCSMVALALFPIAGSPQTSRAAVTPRNEADSCTVANLRETYVVSLNGFTTANTQPDPVGSISNFTPVSEVGTFTFDGAGAVSRVVNVSIGGLLSFPVNDSGKYVVSSDCSGSISLSANSDAFNFNVVNEDLIAIVAVNPKQNQAGAGTLTRQRIRDCSTETFVGAYVFSTNGLGTFMSVPASTPYSTDAFFPVAVVGTWVFDGNGHVTRSVSLAFDGYTFPYADEGTYDVNSDCTLSAYFSSDQEPFHIIAVNPRTLVAGVVTTFVGGVVTPGRVGAGTLVKQSL